MKANWWPTGAALPLHSSQSCFLLCLSSTSLGTLQLLQGDVLHPGMQSDTPRWDRLFSDTAVLVSATAPPSNHNEHSPWSNTWVELFFNALSGVNVCLFISPKKKAKEHLKNTCHTAYPMWFILGTNNKSLLWNKSLGDSYVVCPLTIPR